MAILTTGKTDFFAAEIEFMKTLFTGKGIDHHMEHNCKLFFHTGLLWCTPLVFARCKLNDRSKSPQEEAVGVFPSFRIGAWFREGCLYGWCGPVGCWLMPTAEAGRVREAQDMWTPQRQPARGHDVDFRPLCQPKGRHGKYVPVYGTGTRKARFVTHIIRFVMSTCLREGPTHTRPSLSVCAALS